MQLWAYTCLLQTDLDLSVVHTIMCFLVVQHNWKHLLVPGKVVSDSPKISLLNLCNRAAITPVKILQSMQIREMGLYDSGISLSFPFLSKHRM